MLRFLIENHVKSQDFVIPHAEFTQNNFMNLKIKKTPYKAAYGLKSHYVLDSTILPLGAWVCDNGKAFVDYVWRVYEEIKLL